MSRKIILAAFVGLMLVVTPGASHGMHIMEGFLPLGHSLFWGAVSLPFLVAGILSLKRSLKEDRNAKLYLGLAGGFVFVMSALKIPSVTGSCSHPTGVGLSAIIFGPFATTVVGTIVLLFQAILLAHGGITTLGANMFSMAIAGPLVSYGIFKLLGKAGVRKTYVIFLAASLGNLFTYVVTAFQLAWAFPGGPGGFGGALAKFMSIFAVTQIPLAIIEGILTAMVYSMVMEYVSSEGATILTNKA